MLRKVCREEAPARVGVGASRVKLVKNRNLHKFTNDRPRGTDFGTRTSRDCQFLDHGCT
jgi:hypothetical protein